MFKMEDIEDQFTLDGAVIPPRSVTPAKVEKVAEWITKAKRGSWVAEAQLKESLMSGDLASSVAHYINLITIPQLPEEKDRPVAKLATFVTVPDFRPATLFGIFGDLEGPGVTADGSAPRVAQGQPFPVATITGVESAYSSLAKNGLRVNWDFEDFINDTVGRLSDIPAELQDIALQTEWMEVGNALIKATTSSGTVVLPDGTSIATNKAISANAIMAAIQALSLRTINGTKRKIGTLSGYNVVVGIGQKVFVDYMIRQALGIMYVLPGSAGGAVNPAPDNSILAQVEVIEHEAVIAPKWYLSPKPGAFRRPSLSVLNLRGYETPQIRVQANGGDGFSFDADTAAMRLRLVKGAALWFQNAIVYSAGTG